MQTIKSDALLSHLCSLVVLALATFAGPAQAQTADRPDVKVGDRWKYAMVEDGKASDHVWIVNTVIPDRIEGTDSGKPLVLTPDLNVMESAAGKHSNQKFLSFPLAVGNKWTYADDFMYDLHGGERAHMRAPVRVVGYEKVRVPAGEFDAFKLKISGSYDIEGEVAPGVASYTYWYAPAAHAIVRYESDLHCPALRTHTTFELVEYQLKP